MMRKYDEIIQATAEKIHGTGAVPGGIIAPYGGA
jgi:hypothetical protein